MSLPSVIEIQPHRLRDRRAHRQPTRARVPPQTGDQRWPQPDGEHHSALRHRHPGRCHPRRGHVPARLTLGQRKLGPQRTDRVRRRQIGQQLDRAVHPNRVLVGIRPATCHQALEYHASRPTPPRRPRNRALKLEVRYCVGAVLRPVLGAWARGLVGDVERVWWCGKISWRQVVRPVLRGLTTCVASEMSVLGPAASIISGAIRARHPESADVSVGDSKPSDGAFRSAVSARSVSAGSTMTYMSTISLSVGLE